LFVAKGMRGVCSRPRVRLAPGFGFVAFLAPGLRPSAVGLLVVLLGGAGLVRYVPAEASAVPAVAPWTAPERRVADEEMGLTLAVPQGWVVLKPGNALVTAPAAARATLAQPRVSGYAFLLVEPAPQRVLLPSTTDHVIAERRASPFDEDWRR
jgi:hypothetical protein